MAFLKVFKGEFWKTFWRLCSKREKRMILIFLFFLLLAIVWLSLSHYYLSRKTIPTEGGKMVEGIVGQVSSLNPVIADFSEANRSLISLVYNGLLMPDGEGGYKGDLAKSWKALNDKSVWRVVLRDNIFWQDGQPITTDDIVFTLEKILDPRTRSPLASSWQGVVIKAYDKKIVEFYLKQPYEFFERNLADLKIIPKHIWENIPVDNYWLTDYNLLPIGSGPFKANSYQKTAQGTIKTFTFLPNKRYFKKKPYLEEIDFKFYQDYDEAKEAFAEGKINSLADITLSDSVINFKDKKIKKISIPRFYGVFFNNQSVGIFKDKFVRKALLLATPKEKILEDVLSGQGETINTPFIEGMEGWDESFQTSTFNLEEAKKVLENDGFDEFDDQGVRVKNSKEKQKIKLEFELTFPSSPLLFKVANILKNSWQKIGVKVNLSPKKIEDLREENIFPRCYEAVLLGEASSFHPDLFSFWHSSQKFDPGLNISLFDNEKADMLLENIRKSDNKKEREKDYYKFQEILLKENPAVFLFSPYYFWVLPSSLDGLSKINKIDYSFERFLDIQNWYMKKTKK